MFGTGAPKPMPISSMSLFAARDSMTILASFSLPGLILTTNTDHNTNTNTIQD